MASIGNVAPVGVSAGYGLTPQATAQQTVTAAQQASPAARLQLPTAVIATATVTPGLPDPNRRMQSAAVGAELSRLRATGTLPPYAAQLLAQSLPTDTPRVRPATQARAGEIYRQSGEEENTSAEDEIVT